MNAAIYIRKSREDKNKPAHRLTVQREQLPAHARNQGWTISLYDDGHASAARGKTDDLEERGRLEDDIRAGKVDVILVIELSRLSRDDTLQDYVAWLTLCADHRVKLATMSRILDPGHHSDWMMLIMEGGFSSAEMKVIKGRMMEGRQQAFLAGKFLGGLPPAPYVYDHGLKKPVVDPDLLQQMRKLWKYAESHSAKATAELLGMPEIAVRRAISDERLLFYQGKRKDEQTGMTIDCEWDPVMTEEQARRIRASRRTRKTNDVRRPFAALLSALDLLYCGYCGRTVKSWRNSKIRKDGSQLDYYGCQSKNTKNRCDKSRLIAQPVLEDKILTNVFSTLARLDDLKRFWDSRESKSDRIDSLKQQEKAEEQKKSRLVEAISEGIVSLVDAKERMEKIKDSISRLRDEIATLQLKQKAAPDWSALALSPEDYLQMAIEDRRAFVQTVVERIDIYRTYATVTYHFPRSEDGSCSARVHLPEPARGGAPKHAQVYKLEEFVFTGKKS